MHIYPHIRSELMYLSNQVRWTVEQQDAFNKNLTALSVGSNLPINDKKLLSSLRRYIPLGKGWWVTNSIFENDLSL